ncbi:hypothetical protein SMICM304S_01326 [Streptomyces microflavus]
MVVDFPAPFGPRKPVTRPGRTVNRELVDGGPPAVAFGEFRCFDHGSDATSGGPFANLPAGAGPYSRRSRYDRP